MEDRPWLSVNVEICEGSFLIEVEYPKDVAVISKKTAGAIKSLNHAVCDWVFCSRLDLFSIFAG